MFFGDVVDKCCIVHLKAGDTFMIPSGIDYLLLSSESRQVLNLPPITIFPYHNLLPIFEVLDVDRALLRHGRQSGLSMTNEFEINIV